jgi:glyoxylate/hydroxypyruvate reductase
MSSGDLLTPQVIPVIPLVSRANANDSAAWLTALSLAMPRERIVPFAQLTDTQRREATVAIVANPDPAELNQLPALQWVHSLWAGVERMLAELTNPKIGIVRLEDPQLAETMAEAVLAWTLYLHRDMPAYAAAQRARVWQPQPLRLPSERCVAVLGLGHLGKLAAKRLFDAGFNVIGWARSAQTLPNVQTYAGDGALPEVLGRADLLVCLLPLTPHTRNLLNAHRFNQMKSQAALINFGRGAIVNSADLVNALNENKLSHAVLDVFEIEPLPADNPLWAHEKITVLPHISAPTHKGSASVVVANNIARFRTTGALPKFVDQLVGY